MNHGAFITDGHWRKSLAAVRALGKQGIPVTVGETTWLATAAFSRHCSRRVIYPSPLRHQENFMDWLADHLRRRRHRLLLPMEDKTIGLAAEHREILSRYTFVPVVSHMQMQTAQRKDKVIGLAARLGIPTPRTWLVQDLQQIHTLKNQLPFPVVIKPRQGSGAAGVAYVRDAAGFVAAYERVHRRFALPMVQERIPAHGPGLGASFLLDENSRIKAVFMHRRLREYPVGGGASTLRISIRRRDIQEMGMALLKALNWFGVAMVEFKLDPRDGVPKLMEINPRFWGSLALAEPCGVNFPHLLYRLACGERFAPVTKYRTGVRCRWLLPGDLLHFIHRPDRHRLHDDFFRFRKPGLYYDILSLRDPLPVLGRLLMPLTLLYDKDMKLRMKLRKS